jgi:hypothetical protein
MIAFGCSITSPEIYRRWAEPGIRFAAEPDSVVLAHAAAGTIYRSYNLMLDKAAAFEDLEALVLMHQDAEIVDPGFCSKVRSVLADPEVGVAGAVGATDVRTIAWWEGSVTWGPFVRAYANYGGGDLPELSWNGNELPTEAALGPVDTLDGFILVLSPWAVRNIRFDEALRLVREGFDFDYCMQVRAAGRKVVAADLHVLHHHSLDLVTDPETWMEAHRQVAEKWDGRLPNGDGPEEDWKQRARRAEAEAGVSRLAGASKLLMAYARAEEHDVELGVLEDTVSWRITKPLRELNARRRRLAER